MLSSSDADLGNQCTWPNAGSVALAVAANRFWQVDLESIYVVSNVEVKGSVAGYFQSVQVKVCTDADGATCTNCGSPITGVGTPNAVTAQCDTTGQYVRMEGDTKTAANMHFCRVNVYGHNGERKSH